MDRFRHIVKSLLFPKWWIVLLSVPIAAEGLVYAFAFDHQSDWSAYVCYVLSAVSFTWICARVIRSSGHWKQDASAMVDRVPVAKRYLTDVSFNINVSLHRFMTGCTGGGVCTVILCIAIYMLCRAAKEIKTLELEGKSI